MNRSPEPEVFSQDITVSNNEIDELGHVNNIVYLKWVQNIAEKHWKARASKEDQRRSVWVVLNHFIEYRSPAFPEDNITLKTYVGETTGVKSFRYVEIFRGNTLLAKAKTQWCLLDAETKRPRRITDELRDFFLNEA